MANSKYEYVREYERLDAMLPNTWIVVRIDGRGFHRFSARHGFEKPNDPRALNLMNAAATAVVTELPDIAIAFGVSDEYSFVLQRTTTLFERREAKLVTTITSTFTAYYVHLWPSFFPDTPLSPPLPSFDGRAVLYPSYQNVRDYMSWRQADAHINNLYNTTFWALIQGGEMTPQTATSELSGTLSSDKQGILFSRFGINYNNEPEMYKKGSVVFREYEAPPTVADDSTGQPQTLSKSQQEKAKKAARKAVVVVKHCDIIKDAFWDERPWILGARQ